MVSLIAAIAKGSLAYAYCVGVIVARTVLVAGTLRYELQKDVAGAPKALIAPRTPVTALQLTARATKISLGLGWAEAGRLPHAAIAKVIVKDGCKNFIVSLRSDMLKSYSNAEERMQAELIYT
jgi:hypothetical protein